MSGRRREFNVWAAYVDMFTNLMAMLLMVGLVAAASGGSLAGAQRACTVVSDPETKYFMSQLADRFHSRNPPMSGDCKQALVPQSPEVAPDGVAFVQFGIGNEKPCWRQWGRGCPPAVKPKKGARMVEESLLDATCDDIERILLRNIRQMARASAYPEIRVSIVGHASREWSPNDSYCRDAYRRPEKGKPKATGTPNGDDETKMICNSKLSIARAEFVADHCIRHWSDNVAGIPTTALEREFLATKISPVGESFLDRQVERVFGSGAQRRVTIAFHLPGRMH